MVMVAAVVHCGDGDVVVKVGLWRVRWNGVDNRSIRVDLNVLERGWRPPCIPPPHWSTRRWLGYTYKDVGKMSPANT